MTRRDLSEKGLTEYDLDRAKWHIQHGTPLFREFLATGEHDLEVGFARWLKDNYEHTRYSPKRVNP